MTHAPSQDGVRIWEEQITLPTYAPYPPEKNPVFFEKRHNQGASGKVYPFAITEGIEAQAKDQNYTAVYIENEFIQLIVLPELGGRIYVGMDKTNHYDFFYRNQVIKPALIGLFGSWLSGGVEFNWPLHHRPSTFMPVNYLIEEEADGTKTIWLGEHEGFDRNKGMVGVCLHPHSNVVEAKVRLYNRTPLPQNFLWWANVGVSVNDGYQIIFPPDVYCVNDHGKRAMASWPLMTGKYGVYHQYEFDQDTDISYYKNFTPAGSCFVNKSSMDFMAGYDHEVDAGVVYVANHHISPGKKFFTWGTTEHAKAWEYNLTDEDGPYIELMAGVYTDNQPDFSWTQPYESKVFSQYWYPIQAINHVKNANLFAAVNLEVVNGVAQVGVCTTSERENITIALYDGDLAICETTVDISPATPFKADVDCAIERPTLIVSDGETELIRYTPVILGDTTLPEALTEPPLPEKVETVEELYLLGLHLHQYRQDTRTPESFWEEALRRDPGDARTNNGMGLLAYRRCDIESAEAHFRTAIQRLIRWNLNPYDSEPYYNLGLTLKTQDRYEEAYAAFYKAIWSYAWRTPSYYAIAEIDCIGQEYEKALTHLDLSLETNQKNYKARDLKAVVLRRINQLSEAEILLKETLAVDSLDFWARFELAQVQQQMGNAADAGSTLEQLAKLMRGDASTYLDLAFDYGNAGFYADALAVLAQAAEFCGDAPMVAYSTGYFLLWLDRPEDALQKFLQAETCSPDYCFPSQLHEMLVLRSAIRHLGKAHSAKACYYLGNLLYDKRQHEKAMALWEKSVKQDSNFGMAWRNLGIAAFNQEKNLEKAIACYEQALPLDADNARTFFEYDRLKRRANTAPEIRKALFDQHPDLVDARIDLYIENIKLLALSGEAGTALEKMKHYRFTPWENSEGSVGAVYEDVSVLSAKELMASGQNEKALAVLQAALVYPDNLGEGKTKTKLDGMLHYFIGTAQQALGCKAEAQRSFEMAASEREDFSPACFYQALALKALGRVDEASEKMYWLLEKAIQEKERDILSGFSHSFSSVFSWPEDPQIQHEIYMTALIGMAKLGLDDLAKAQASFNEVLEMDANHFNTRFVMELFG